MADTQCPEVVWTESLIRDLTTDLLGSLLAARVLRMDLPPGEARAAITGALTAAGITPGAVR